MEIELLIGHLKNKNIIQSGLFQNKIRPGVLQFSVHKTNPMKECHDTKHCHYASIVSPGFKSVFCMEHVC